MPASFEFLSDKLQRRLHRAANQQGCSVETLIERAARKHVDALENISNPDPSADPPKEDSAPTDIKFRVLAQRSLVGIYLFSESTFDYVNPHFADLVGYPADNLIGHMGPQDIVHPDDWPKIRENIERRLRGEVTAIHDEFRLLTNDDTVRHVEAYGSYLPYQDRDAIIGTLWDVTDHKQRERDLIEAKEEAERMNRLKSSFLANMSHEIRTPITAILGFTDVLAERVSSAEQQFIEIIQQSGHRLLETVESVLHLAQLESDSLTLRPQPLEVNVHVKNIADRFRQRAQAKGLGFHVETPAEPVDARMDPSVLEHVIAKLTDNALKFTKEGTVTVAATADDKNIVLRIEDTGIGVDAARVDELFEAFQQASTGSAREFEGSGLGLTITKKLVDLAGGHLTFTSDTGKGTAVTVRLPRYVPTAAGEKGPLSTAHKWGLSLLPANQQVLVVEDDPYTAELLPQLLPDTYEVDVAMDAACAEAKAKNARFDVVLMDINLKDTIDGVELRERMCRLEDYKNTLFIAITAYARPGDGDRFHEAGFDGYVAKPFEKETLYQNLIQIRQAAALES